MKKTICLLLLFLLCINVFAKDNNKEDNTEVPFFEVRPEVKSVTSAELEFSDKDDSSVVAPGLTKSTPQFEEELSAFIRVNRFGTRNFVFGPYGFYSGEMKFRRISLNDSEIKSNRLRSYFLPKKMSGFGGAGFRIGLKKEKKEFKGSSLYFSVPFSLFYDINDKDDAANWKSAETIEMMNISEADYFSFFYIGSGVEIDGKLKSKTTKLEVSVNERFLFGFEPYSIAERNDAFYFANSLNAKVEFSPFDFFCKEVNITFEAGDKLDVVRNTYHIQVKNRVWAGLTWKPLKYFKLITIPFYFKTDCKFKTEDTDFYYDWTEEIYGKYGVYFGADNIGFEISVSPDYWAAYRENSAVPANINSDSVRTVAISAELTLKY